MKNNKIINLIKGYIDNDFEFDNVKLEDFRFIWKEAQKEMLEQQISLIQDLGKDNIEIYELKLLLKDFQ